MTRTLYPAGAATYTNNASLDTSLFRLNLKAGMPPRLT